jgi:predicted flap endonuclease-1-like 5' DNA nuclease
MSLEKKTEVIELVTKALKGNDDILVYQVTISDSSDGQPNGVKSITVGATVKDSTAKSIPDATLRDSTLKMLKRALPALKEVPKIKELPVDKRDGQNLPRVNPEFEKKLTAQGLVEFAEIESVQTEKCKVAIPVPSDLKRDQWRALMESSPIGIEIYQDCGDKESDWIHSKKLIATGSKNLKDFVDVNGLDVARAGPPPTPPVWLAKLDEINTDSVDWKKALRVETKEGAPAQVPLFDPFSDKYGQEDKSRARLT